VSELDNLRRLRRELYNALQAQMGEPDFTTWFVNVFRDKLAEVKGSQGDRDRGHLHIIDTQDLTQTASFEAAKRGRGGK